MLKTLFILSLCFTVSIAWATDVGAITKQLSSGDYNARQQARVQWMQLFADASAPNADAESHQNVERAVIDALKAELPLSQRLYLIRMLEQFGGDASVQVLYPLLNDAELAIRDSARRALAGSSSDEATSYLVKAFTESKTDERPLYVDALAYRGDSEATRVLLQILESSDSDLVGRAVQALVIVGDSAAVPALLSARAESPSENRLQFEMALLSIGLDADTAYMLTRSSDSAAVRVGAFARLIDLDVECSLQVISEVLAEPDYLGRPLFLREAIMRGSAEMQQQVLSTLPDASTRDQIIIVTAIGERGLSEYESALLARFPNADTALKPALIEALGSIGGDSSFEVLYAAFEAAPKDTVLAVSLARLKAPSVDEKALATVANGTDTQAKINALKLLTLRNTAGATEVLNSIAAEPGDAKLRIAIFKALEVIGDFDSVVMLIHLIEDQGPLLRPAQQSLKRLSINFGEPDYLWDELYHPALDSAQDDAVRESLILILDGVAGSKSLSYLEELAKDRSSPLSTVAVRTLTRWPNVDSGDYWLSVALDETASAKERAVAERAIKRLFYNKDIKGEKQDQLEFAVRAIQQAPSVEFKEMVVASYEDGLHWKEVMLIRGIFEPLKEDPDVGERVAAIVNF